MNVRRVLVHAALLVAPAAALDLLAHAGAHVTRPQGLACVVLAVALGEVEASMATRPDPSRAGAPGTRLALASALGLLLTTWAAVAFPSPSLSTPWSWLGVPLVVAGIALRASAIRALGASFTSEIVAAPGRSLVTSGIYARLRHPSDAGLLLVALGLAWLGTSLAALLVALVVVLPSVIARVRAEERVLAEADPAAHAAYRARVGLLTTARRCQAPSSRCSRA